MSREFPDWINPWASAQGRRQFQGTMPLKRLERLAALLVNVDGEACFRMSLELDSEQRPVITIDVAAGLPLVCQASLKPYTHEVERQSLLGVVAEEAEESLLPDYLDPVVADNGRLAIAALVEDELILAMPQVPRNPALEAVEYVAGDEPEEVVEDDSRQHPFADLGKMMSGDAGDKAK